MILRIQKITNVLNAIKNSCHHILTPSNVALSYNSDYDEFQLNSFKPRQFNAVEEKHLIDAKQLEFNLFNSKLR